ncbi:hypothetical protein GPUN_2713 [Glaciecola punicea ACAM 611]|uniref:Uncharacterized protein n=1 Tax=Glaciecola punicea ACAM 611 TaxID=1121923 RepID=H5TFE7_9ALTE|nr:hypothetical protein GPUN_2713 [Glaciecola punicea ACAM 611]
MRHLILALKKWPITAGRLAIKLQQALIQLTIILTSTKKSDPRRSFFVLICLAPLQKKERYGSFFITIL